MNDLLPVEALGFSPAAAPPAGVRGGAPDGLSFAAVVEAETNRAQDEEKQSSPDILQETAAAQAAWLAFLSALLPEAAVTPETEASAVSPAAYAAEASAPRPAPAHGDWGRAVHLLDRVVSAVTVADEQTPAVLAGIPSLLEATAAGLSAAPEIAPKTGPETAATADRETPAVAAALAALSDPAAESERDGTLLLGLRARLLRLARVGVPPADIQEQRTAEVPSAEMTALGGAAADEPVPPPATAAVSAPAAVLTPEPTSSSADAPAPTVVPAAAWSASEAARPEDGAAAGPPKQAEAPRAAETPAAVVPYVSAAPVAEAPVTLPAGAGPEEAAQAVRRLVASAVLHEGAAPEIRLRLQPEFLGRVNIVLTATAEGMAIRIRAENEAVRGLLAAHAAEWQAELRSQGVPMRSLDVTGGTLAWDMTGGDAQRTGADTRQGRRREEDGRPDGARVVPLARFRAARGAPAYEAPPSAEDGAGVDLRA